MNSIAIALKQSEQKKYKSIPENSEGGSDRNDRNSQPGAEECITGPKTELHLNLWRLNSGFLNLSTRFFLDVGIKVKCCYNEICLFLPFSLRKNNKWKNLGDCLCNDNNLLSAVFNEDLRAVPLDNNCFHRIEAYRHRDASDSKYRFYIYSMGPDNVSVSEYDYGGTWFNIKVYNDNIPDFIRECDKDDDCSHYYVRFRLFLQDKEGLAHRRHISNDLIQAAFSNLDLYDIRINVPRNLDKKVREKLQAEKFVMPSFSKIHIFYIADTKVSIETSSNIKSDSRIIEPYIWKSYEPEDMADGLFIAHHWKATVPCEKDKELPPIDSLNLFFTAKYPKIHLFTLLAYFSIVVVLGGIGSWLTSGTGEGYQGLSYVKIITVSLMAVSILWYLVRNLRMRIKIWLKQ